MKQLVKEKQKRSEREDRLPNAPLFFSRDHSKLLALTKECRVG